MIKGGKIGVIDNQDALIGNRAYDLASLIDDVRLKTSNLLKDKIYKHYVQTQNKIDKNKFRNDFEILSVLRNLKIIGIFTRLAIRDKKKNYLNLIPYTWTLINRRINKNKIFDELKLLLNEYFKKNMKIKTALILCAGFGKRLNPLTLETPKPLLKIKNISMLEHCINLVVSLGIKNIILNTYHLEDKIIDFIKKKNFSINIEIKKDGVKILDTGGGILNMINSSLENDFLIFNPDTLWNEKYYQDIKKMQEYYFSQNLNNILLLTKKNNSFDSNLTGDFNLKNNFITKDSKEFIFIGCQILNKELFRNYQINNFSISEIWENLLQTKGLNGYESENKFYHLTNLEIFKRLQDL